MDTTAIRNQQPTYTLSIVPSRNIIRANPAGNWTEEAIVSYTDEIISKAKQFSGEKWAFMPDVTKMAPIADIKTANAFKVSQERLKAAGCAALAFVVGESIAAKPQEQQHQDVSNVEKLVMNYFKNEEDALEWLKELDI